MLHVLCHQGNAKPTKILTVVELTSTGETDTNGHETKTIRGRQKSRDRVQGREWLQPEGLARPQSV